MLTVLNLERDRAVNIKLAAQQNALNKFGLDARSVGRFLLSDDIHPVGPGPVETVSRVLADRKSGKPTPSVSTAVAEGLINKAKYVGQVGYRMAVQPLTLGSPIGLNEQLKSRGWLNTWKDSTLGGHTGEPGVLPHLERGLLTGMNVALPLGYAYLDMKNRPGHGGEIGGGALANLLASPFLGRLGIPGMMLQAPVSYLGRQLGKYFDKPEDEPKTAGILNLLHQNPAFPLYGAGVAAYGLHKLLDYKQKSDMEESIKRQRASAAIKTVPRLLASMAYQTPSDDTFYTSTSTLPEVDMSFLFSNPDNNQSAG